MENMNMMTDASNGMDMDGHSRLDLPETSDRLQSGGEQAVLVSTLVLGALHTVDGRTFDIDAFLAGVRQYYLDHKDEPRWMEAAQNMQRQAKELRDDADLSIGDGSDSDDKRMAALLGSLGIGVGGTDNPGDDVGLPEEIKAQLAALGDGGVGDDDDVQDDATLYNEEATRSLDPSDPVA